MVSVPGSKFRVSSFWSTMVSYNMHLLPKGFKKNRNMDARNKELETRPVRRRVRRSLGGGGSPGEVGNPKLILV
jgi:hypothetical protein